MTEHSVLFVDDEVNILKAIQRLLRHEPMHVLTATDPHGREHKITYEPIGTFQMKGIGYSHPEWGHAAWKGEYAIGREDFKPLVMPWIQPDNLHIQAIAKVRHEGPDGQGSEGIGALEQLFIGPHDESGWKDLLDA